MVSPLNDELGSCKNESQFYIGTCEQVLNIFLPDGHGYLNPGNYVVLLKYCILGFNPVATFMAAVNVQFPFFRIIVITLNVKNPQTAVHASRHYRYPIISPSNVKTLSVFPDIKYLSIE
jgi:hypothetical protein